MGALGGREALARDFSPSHCSPSLPLLPIPLPSFFLIFLAPPSMLGTPIALAPRLLHDRFRESHEGLTPPHTNLKIPYSFMLMQTSPARPILPATPEHEWRLSYQFTRQRVTLLTRVSLSAGLVGLMIVVAKAAW